MKIYIAYKLSNLPEQEKHQLRPKLEQLSSILTKLGHQTFIMGRDAQNWTKENNSSIKTIALIFKYLNNYETVLAFIDSKVSSLGMAFEIIYAKLFGKKIIYLFNNSLTQGISSKLASEVIIYNDMLDLESKLTQRFS